ncbi:ATP-binding cassette domain-containing protein [Lutibacter sp. HS1-25]|uniref:ABC transporter ATP-binding protein n=1 Tax=Lutibacter sp. HS1-25 TaxID=2485000 RepID=UPI001013160F|nr:ABC transporter ATP-binding protein [Lutibacter sp. HS1-25]RXP52916.1 ATP-binding cassette domain-containing protein [Lutibacter sp. HS1-25]
MQEEVLVKVENLSKKFCKDLKTSLWYGVKDLYSNAHGNKQERTLRDKEFWAVKDINFELRRGECLGLIGHNGAGKSTLLKILNGLINPDEGKVTIKGRVGALIELGAGFNPILTGRENIYNNGAILGFTKKEIEAKVEDIIDFAEIREFIDMPVQHYSSGMKVRLGFAVAAQMEPDVLIIDEVLAVGDVGFRIKCLNTISELLNNCAVIFVSHSMPQIGKIANKGLLLKNGRIVLNSKNISFLIQNYYNEFKTENESVFGSGKAEINNFTINNKQKNIIIKSREKFIINFDLKVSGNLRDYLISICFYDQEMKSVALISNKEDDFIQIEENIQVEVINVFAPGKYTVTVDVIELKNKNILGEYLLSKRNICDFISLGSKQLTHCPIHLPANWK